MKKIAKRNNHLYKRLYNLLEANILDVINSRIADIMVFYYKNTVEDNWKLIVNLKKGFVE